MRPLWIDFERPNLPTTIFLTFSASLLFFVIATKSAGARKLFRDMEREDRLTDLVLATVIPCGRAAGILLPAGVIVALLRKRARLALLVGLGAFATALGLGVLALALIYRNLLSVIR